MNSFPKLMISLGIIFIIIGVISYAVGRIIPIGKLPGDIVIKKENMTVYFPIVTSIIVSIVLTFIFFLLGRIR